MEASSYLRFPPLCQVGTKLDITVGLPGGFPPLAACMAPFGTMKAVPEGGGSPSISSANLPVSKSTWYLLLQPLGGNQGLQQQLIMFWESLGLR